MEERDREDFFSKRVKAGKRTYFFDVKATKSNDYFIAITESRRYPTADGFAYEKQKLFLYKEDFHKFVDALNQTVDFVKLDLMPEIDFEKFKENDELFGGSSDLKWE